MREQFFPGGLLKYFYFENNLISSEGGQDTSTCKISDHSLHAFSGKCPETSPDGRTDWRTCRKTVTVGRMDQRNHVQVKRGYFRLRTSLSMNKPTIWCKSGRVSLVSSSCLYKTQPERALAQVCQTRIDRTDGQPENIIPPVPKGGGIKKGNDAMEI